MAVLALAVASVSAPTAGAATINVTSNADNATDDQLCTLREALLAAGGNADVSPAGGVDCPAGEAGPATDTIVIGDIPPNGPDTITLGASLNISSSAGQGPNVIDGRGPALTVVDAADMGRVFNVTGNTSATLKDLAMTNGNLVNSAGAGIRSISADLTLSNVTVSNNAVTSTNAVLGFGAGVSVDDGTLTITDSTITGNTISATGGTVRGGGIQISGDKGATIDRTNVSGNALTNTDGTEAVRGGGLIVDEADADVEITNSTFSANNLSGGTSHLGGGIYWGEADNDGPGLGLENTTFSGNSVANASGEGGALYLNGGAVSIAHSTFGPHPNGTGRGYSIGASPGSRQIRNSVFETGGVDCSPSGSFTSLGFNVEKSANDCGFAGTGDVVTTVTLLNSLGNRGGPTQTHSLSLGSGVINLIPLASCLGSDGLTLTRDQRNALRPGQGEAAMCDPGASEVNRCGTALVEIVGTDGDDMLVGDAGEDAILGMGGADRIDPDANDDDACGGNGNDVFLAHEPDNATDLFNGEAGSDTVSLEQFLDPATINLSTGQVIGANLGADLISSIENATGGLDPDTLIGDSGANILDGFLDGDSITGGGGSDTLLGNAGDDALFARDGVADLVDCGLGSGDTAQTDQRSLDTVIGCESVDALAEPPPPPAPPVGVPGATGQRAAALKKCKRKKTKTKRRKCRRRALKLPL